MTSPARAADAEEAGAAVDALEAAFRRITQVAKRSIRSTAASIHPELRAAGWVVFTVVNRGCPDGRPVTVGEIIAETNMDKSVVSRQLRSLNEWGLVEMSRSESDARVVVVQPTELARERFRGVRERQRDVYKTILSTWSKDDLGKLEELLNRLADTLAEW